MLFLKNQNTVKTTEPIFLTQYNKIGSDLRFKCLKRKRFTIFLFFQKKNDINDSMHQFQKNTVCVRTFNVNHVAILLSLVCLTVLRRYYLPYIVSNLRKLSKYVITFKARNLYINNLQCYCGLCYSYYNWYGQEDFTSQETWRTSIYLFKVCWNDHLVSYFSLM